MATGWTHCNASYFGDILKYSALQSFGWDSLHCAMQSSAVLWQQDQIHCTEPAVLHLKGWDCELHCQCSQITGRTAVHELHCTTKYNYSDATLWSSCILTKVAALYYVGNRVRYIALGAKQHIGDRMRCRKLGWGMAGVLTGGQSGQHMRAKIQNTGHKHKHKYKHKWKFNCLQTTNTKTRNET